MDPKSSALPEACSGECSSCSFDANDVAESRDPAALQGWSMAGASLLFFLVPLLIAAASAVALKSHGPALQWVAGIAGLLAGMALTSLIARRIGRR